MNNAQRYFIAKYVPDVRRMEPVNIGIILWARGRTSMKFLPPEDSASFVNDMAVYKRWVDYWTRLLVCDSIETRDGQQIPKKSPDFMGEFAKTQKDNYLLAEAGEVMDRVTARNMEAAASYLFDELVARRGKHQPSPREQAIQLKYRLCNGIGLR